MEPTLEDGLHALNEAANQAPSIRIDLDQRYLAAIALVEAEPANQSGSDKTWVMRTDEAFREHYRNIQRA